MPHCTIVAPRKLWQEVVTCLESISPTTSIWCREAKPSEPLEFSIDAGNNLAIVIYEVKLLHDDTIGAAEVTQIQELLSVKWPYIQAEKVSSLVY